MHALLLRKPKPADQSPLEWVRLPDPEPVADEILIRVRACGVCRTDLHTVEGEISSKLPIVPGHEIVGIVEQVGERVKEFKQGDRVGVPWLHSTCGECEFCKSDRENLCVNARFTGFHANGGYAEAVVAKADFAVRIPDRYEDAEVAPLLCAGIIGYRSLKLSEIQRGQRIGLYGFGASAHIAIQVARHWDCEAFVATRGANHRLLAKELGARWVGQAEEVPVATLDSAIIFAPAGPLVPEALRALKKGGTLALAGIYMSPIPQMKYEVLYHERTLRSVANATREDARELMKLAGEFTIRTEVETFPLKEANRVLQLMKDSKLKAAGVLQVSG